MKRAIAAALVFSFTLSACGNTVHGPRKLVQVGQFDGDSYHTGTGENKRWHDRSCSTKGKVTQRNSPLDLTMHFYDLACASFRAPDDPLKAQRMMNAGVTLTMIRCNDFFSERAANQTRGRVIREAIPPVSALLTGIIGLLNFDTVEDQEDAIQILALGQTATIAGLEVFQREFLFDTDNIFAVRRLTMRALDEHSFQILESDAGFYPATRHLIEHQMICTPASILELVTQAIDDGQINSYSKRIEREREREFETDRYRLRVLATEFDVPGPLTADELGALWVLDRSRRKSTTLTQEQLAELKTRLGRIEGDVFTGAAGALVATVPDGVQDEFGRFSDELKTYLDAQAIEFVERYSPEGIAEAADDDSRLTFGFPDGLVNQSSRRVEVGVGEQGPD